MFSDSSLKTTTRPLMLANSSPKHGLQTAEAIALGACGNPTFLGLTPELQGQRLQVDRTFREPLLPRLVSSCPECHRTVMIEVKCHKVCSHVCSGITLSVGYRQRKRTSVYVVHVESNWRSYNTSWCSDMWAFTEHHRLSLG